MPYRERPLSAALRHHLLAREPAGKSFVRQDRRYVALPVIAVLILGPAAVVVMDGVTVHELLLAVALAAVVAVCELVVNDADRAARYGALHPTVAVVTAALLWLPGPYIVCGVALGTLVTALAWRRNRLQVWWSVARDALWAAAALTIVYPDWGSTFSSPLVEVTVAVTAGAVLREVLAALAETPAQAGVERAAQLWNTTYHHGLAVSFGLLAGYLLPRGPMWALALAVPVWAVMRDYGSRRSRMAERELFETMLEHLKGKDERGVGPAAELTFVGAESVFRSGATRVTLTWLGDGGPWRLERNRAGALERHVAFWPGPGSREFRALADSSSPAVTGPAPEGAYFTAVLGPMEAPLAVLDVAWSGQPLRRRAEREELGRTLVAHATSWLRSATAAERASAAESKAADATGDVATLAVLGDQARPALDSLREATVRVSDLARTPRQGDVGEIVEELDRVALAVASLLGAVTAVAHPDTSAAARPYTPPPVSSDLAATAPASVRPEGAPSRVRLGIRDLNR